MFPLRDENPSHRFPFFVVLIILMNIVAFLFEASLGPRTDEFIANFAVIPNEFTRGWRFGFSSVLEFLPLLTSMFLHGGLAHLAGNMWFLWLFGDNLEDYLGHISFVIFYLATGLAAGLVHILANPLSNIPTIGASGAISGVLGGYIMLYPHIRIKTLMVLGFYINVVRVPAYFFLGIWFVLQMVGGLGQDSGVAFGAHIGGFIAGLLFMLFFSRKSPVRPHERYEPTRLPRWH